MKRPTLLLLIVVSLLLGWSWVTTSVVADEPRPKTAAAQQGGQGSPYGGSRGGMMTEGMMGGPGMMSGMTAGCPAMMWDLDSKTRGQMLQIQGKMMTEMGELMVKRGKEIEQSK